MPRRKKPKLKKRIPPCRRIPLEHGHLTATARQLYDLVFSFGLAGCWMSNRTLASKLQVCRRSAQYARKLLVHRQLIITARTNPHTWIMWSRFHPGVKQCQILLYPIKQKMDNPYYEIPTFRVGVQKSTLRGAKFAPKLDVANTSALATGEGSRDVGCCPSLPAESATTADAISHQGGKPPLPPAVQGESWTKSEVGIIIHQKYHRDLLMDNGLIFHEAGDMILAEWYGRFTIKELSWLEELMELGLHPYDAFDVILEERNPETKKWLNHPTKSKT